MRALGTGSYRVCLVALAALFLVLVASMFQLRSWPFELLNHFVLQYLLIAGCLCFIFGVIGKKAPAAVALVFVLAFAADYRQAPQPPSHVTPIAIGIANASVAKGSGLPSRRLSLMTYNVYSLNTRGEDIIAWLSTRPADVVALEEIPRGMIGALQVLKDVYPHQFTVEPGARLNAEVYAGDESLAILSIHPITEQAIVRPSGQGKLSLLAKISIEDAEDPWIVVVHPSNPSSPARLAARDSYLFDLAALIRELAGPVIVAGDFNLTPFAPSFPLFLNASRTSMSRGFPATWPSMLGPLGIPIDHVLVREARLTGVEAFPSMGSDHRALKAEILLPGSADETKYAGGVYSKIRHSGYSETARNSP